MRRSATRRLAGAIAIVLTALVALLTSAGPAAAARPPWIVTLTVQTVPVLSGVRVELDGVTVTTDATGQAVFARPHDFDAHTLELVDTEIASVSARDRFVRWVGQRDSHQAFSPTVTGLPMRADYTVTAAFATLYPVTIDVTDDRGAPLDAARLGDVSLRDSAGRRVVVTAGEETWLDGWRPVYRSGRLVRDSVTYSVDSILVDGTGAVTAGAQRIDPAASPHVQLTVPLFRMQVSATDALFDRREGDGIVVTRPDGVRTRITFGPDRVAELSGLPRGAYEIEVQGASGVVAPQIVHLSKDKAVTLMVITPLDLFAVAAISMLAAVGLLAAGRLMLRHRTRRLASYPGIDSESVEGSDTTEDPEYHRGLGAPPRTPKSRWIPRPKWRWVGILVATLLCCTLGMSPQSTTARSLAAPPVAASVRMAPALTASGPTVLAYYYLWFSKNSWNRAKIDYPWLGRYSSGDPRVLRQHIRWAKQAGISGFIVSWKSTTTNNRRLHRLMDVARDEDFTLAMIYQGLDFTRDPLPVERVRADFEAFARDFAPDAVFHRLDGKPLTIFSGTWKFSATDVAHITDAVRSDLLVLSTEKNVEGYERIASSTDGNAYYWSSVNPATNTRYAAKLRAMGEAVHADGKYWLAPFAPGFDARLVGGTRVVHRLDGSTLRAEYAAAVASDPDLLGLISWNEFSENSHVEPSETYGTQSLDVLGELLLGEEYAPVTLPRSR
ncbi:endo-1,3-alpha-glucanase family glycosylhydrolase [Agromyces humatus]|uniref:Glycosyl hydrolase family 99 n=1 Tax=Agromyces humatus TaxID=279573 RepID=A0ABN2KW59_9MICO|nr:endo-1,3-alpha-glucanase family glycosylhydrolase [Agromyces humatus]